MRGRILNYSLRPAKNIERKMMGEAFARLAPLFPLEDYRYVGFGSEFFNDFSLYHQTLGIRDMVSIESDMSRINRCKFNKPYKCIKVLPGSATVVLPKLIWTQPSIVWLDYVDKLNRTIVSDVRFLVSQIASGSVLVVTVNANPLAGGRDAQTGGLVKASDLPRKRLEILRSLFGNTRSFDTSIGVGLADWGLAGLFYDIIVDEVLRSLHDRNAASAPEKQIEFRQCFHFRYADGQRMLTVGGLFLNPADAAILGANPFRGLSFIRSNRASIEIKPPTLTGREARHLNRLLPHGARPRLP
jgi:hypothetical protein